MLGNPSPARGGSKWTKWTLRQRCFALFRSACSSSAPSPLPRPRRGRSRAPRSGRRERRGPAGRRLKVCARTSCLQGKEALQIWHRRRCRTAFCWRTEVGVSGGNGRQRAELEQCPGGEARPPDLIRGVKRTAPRVHRLAPTPIDRWSDGGWQWQQSVKSCRPANGRIGWKADIALIITSSMR